jgi:hypothetical protein
MYRNWQALYRLERWRLRSLSTEMQSRIYRVFGIRIPHEKIKKAFGWEVLSFSCLSGVGMGLIGLHRFTDAIILFSLACCVVAIQLLFRSFAVSNWWPWKVICIVTIFLGCWYADQYLLGVVRDAQNEYYSQIITVFAESSRNESLKAKTKKTTINITNPNPPLLDKEPPNPPALLLNVQFRNAGTFPANRFAHLGRIYLLDQRSDLSEASVVNEFRGYADSMKKDFPKESITLGPGERTTETLFRIFNNPNPADAPKDILEIFRKQVLYVVVLAGYYDDNGYYHESHFCASIAWNQVLGFSQAPCNRFGDQY